MASLELVKLVKHKQNQLNDRKSNEIIEKYDCKDKTKHLIEKICCVKR